MTSNHAVHRTVGLVMALTPWRGLRPCGPAKPESRQEDPPVEANVVHLSRRRDWQVR